MSLSLDGSASAVNFFATTVTTGTLTTTTGSGVIICALLVGGSASTSGIPTATGLTFTLRKFQTSGAITVYIYTAPYTTNFSGTVTVNITGGGAIIEACAFGIGGAATTSSFDPNASVPNAVTGTDPSVTTSNANDFLVAAEYTTSNGPTAGTGFTEVIPVTFTQFMVQYRIVSATGSYTATLGSGGPALIAILDAIVQAGAGPTATYGTIYLMGVG